MKNHPNPDATKTILVTGASKGIGLAIARRFLAEGFQVVICASTAESLAGALEQQPDLDAMLCDMTDPAAIDRLSVHVAERYGALDVLVNNAGIYVPGQLHTENDEALDRMFQINVKSAYLVSKRMLPAMMARRTGSIFNMCSTASITPYVNGGSYCVSKYALLGFSKVLREEMKPHNIRVTAVLPGATMTASWDGSGVEPCRLMPPEDVASAVWAAYSLSDRTVIEEILLRPLLGDLA